jgi:hypothetical protein
MMGEGMAGALLRKKESAGMLAWCVVVRAQLGE